MSEGYECDRCGSLHAGSPDTALTVEDGYGRHALSARREEWGSQEGDIRPEHIDLCRGCLNDLRKWYQEAGGDAEDIEYE